MRCFEVMMPPNGLSLCHPIWKDFERDCLLATKCL